MEQAPVEHRRYWLHRYSVEERRRLAYAIANRAEENDSYRMHDIARKIVSGIETPFDYGFDEKAIEAFFIEEAVSRLGEPNERRGTQNPR